MKKYILSVVCLLVFFLVSAQDNSTYKMRSADLQYETNKTLADKSRANYFNYAALGPQKTREEIAREKREFILCCFAGVFVFVCFCFALFPFVKNKFNHIKNKTKLHRRQRAGKHTLDDVFAAEKKE